MDHYSNSLIDTFGNAISGASVQVYAAGTTTASTLYSDNSETSTTNPLTSGADGSFDFYAADGRYDLLITHPGHTFSDADWAGIVLLDHPLTTLDWTVSLGGTTTYTLRSGKSFKVGALVTINCSLIINAIGTGATNTISGLPYVGAGYRQSITVGYTANLGSSVVSLNAIVPAGQSTIIVYGRTAAADSASALTMFADNTEIDLHGSYFTTS